MSPDYPYCLTGKELKGVIKGLIARCGDILPDLFDHCVYTMLRELDRQSGKSKSSHGGLEVVCAVNEDRGHAVMKAIVMQQPLISFHLLLKIFLLLLLLTATYLS